jgi:hypothetical protein
VNVRTATTEERIDLIHRHIDELEWRAHAATAAARLRIQHHVDALRRREADARIALRTAPERLEYKLAQLHARLDVAGHSVAVEIAPDEDTFEDAVEAELQSWDVFFERVQTTAVAEAWNRRLQAEAAVSEMRALRLEIDERLAALRMSPPVQREEQRARVTKARERLERIADEYSARLLR